MYYNRQTIIMDESGDSLRVVNDPHLHEKIRNPLGVHSVSEKKVKCDFVQVFPQELSTKLFTYVSEQDLVSCARCCIGWHQAINDNVQWKVRCIRRGWATKSSGANQAQKWNQTVSHVCKDQVYRFWKSPIFRPSVSVNDDSLRISPQCSWALYFHQCLHIQRNWDVGIYVIHRLGHPSYSDHEAMILNSDFDCNGKLLVVGTTSGRVHLWSVEGVPQFLGSISIRRKMEVASVILKAHFLIVLYQSGLLKVYDTRKLANSTNFNGLELLYAVQGIGKRSIDGLEFIINVLPIQEDDFESWDENDDDIEICIRDLFQVDLWLGNDTMYGNVAVYANDAIVVFTGSGCIGCRCFHWWKLLKGSSEMRQVLLPPEYHVLSEKYGPCDVYGNIHRNLNSPSFILVYDLESLEDSSQQPPNQIMILPQIIIPAVALVEGIRSDSLDKRIVFATIEGDVCGVSLNNDGSESLFHISASPTDYVDNLTVSDTLIVYHQYDGFLVGINWSGQQLYQFEAHYGLVKGLQIFENRLLVSGANAMQLCVWDAQTGEKLHTVYHQPCRIQDLYLDATKIITVGREDSPVVVAYW